MFLKKNLWLTLTAALLFTLSSCKEEAAPPPELTFDDGIFITNEGIYGGDSGTLSFFSRKTGQMSNNIFQNTNDGEALGNIVYSMTTHNDLAYIVVNNAEKIVVANANNFKKVAEITNLKQPRFFLPVSDEKAFVSQWGIDGVTGSIEVVDLLTHQVVNTISIRPGPEKMIKVDDFVYVANSGGFGLDSVITKIDIASESIVKTIEVGLYPSHIVSDKNQAIWVLTGGYNDWMDPSNNLDGRFVKIVNDEVETSMIAKQGASNLSINNAQDKLYFSMDNKIFEHEISETTMNVTPLIDKYFYGLGIDPETDDIIGLDPLTWDQDGLMFIYDENGITIDSMKVGIGPGTLWFN